METPLIKKILKTRFNEKEPTRNDVKWYKLNHQYLEALKKRDAEAVITTRRKMIEILEDEGRIGISTLPFIIEVLYLHMNYYFVDPQEWYLEQIFKLFEEGKVTKEEIMQQFLKYGHNAQKVYPMENVPPETFWNFIYFKEDRIEVDSSSLIKMKGNIDFKKLFGEDRDEWYNRHNK